MPVNSCYLLNVVYVINFFLEIFVLFVVVVKAMLAIDAKHS